MERELKTLLNDLCAKWGFCIPEEDFDSISKQQYYRAEDFALDVVLAEGLEYSEWVSKIGKRFKQRFGSDEIHAETFVDRIRGIKENWRS